MILRCVVSKEQNPNNIFLPQGGNCHRTKNVIVITVIIDIIIIRCVSVFTHLMMMFYVVIYL